MVPQCHEGESQEKAKSSSKFSNQRRKRIDQLLLLYLGAIGHSPERKCKFFWLKCWAPFFPNQNVFLVTARFQAACLPCYHWCVSCAQSLQDIIVPPEKKNHKLSIRRWGGLFSGKGWDLYWSPLVQLGTLGPFHLSQRVLQPTFKTLMVGLKAFSCGFTCLAMLLLIQELKL